MRYKLVIVEAAELDVDEIYRYILARSAQGASAWYREFLGCTDRIVQQPLAFAVAPESAEFVFEFRQAFFKTRRGNPYRCVFTVIGDEVRVLRVRGRGQPPLRASDLPAP